MNHLLIFIAVMSFMFGFSVCAAILQPHRRFENAMQAFVPLGFIVGTIIRLWGHIH